MTSRQIDVLRKITEERKEKLKKGDELPPGVIKLVKVYIAMKAQAVHRRQDGRPARQQGRHRAHRATRRYAILPDGTPVEIVLNPLGVSVSYETSGRFLETHLGWAAKELGNSFEAFAEQGSSRRSFAPLVP